MATKGGKARRLKAAMQDVQACRQENGADTVARARAKPAPHPHLRAGVFGRVEYVTTTLTAMDKRAPGSSGRLLPDGPGHGPRPLPLPGEIARDISEGLPQWHHLHQDGLQGDALRNALGA